MNIVVDRIQIADLIETVIGLRATMYQKRER